MRATLLSISAVFACVLSLWGSATHAQPQAPSNPENLIAVNTVTVPAAMVPTPALAPGANDPTDANATVQLTGKVLSPTGILPGAVVTVTGTKLKAVTNENGEFNLSVPAGSPTMSLTTSYAGFADETVILTPGTAPVTLSLTKARPIKVARRQQLKAYMKTARKQVNKQVRRARKGR